MTVPPNITATNTIPEQPTSHHPTALVPALLAGSDALAQNLVMANRSDVGLGARRKLF